MAKINIFQRKFLLLIIIFFSIQFFEKNLLSVEPNEVLKNKQQETLARKISKNIRCLVCQNQSIDDSNAPLAKDLRLLIRTKIKEGNSVDEIYNFLISRYGDFILLKPPLQLNTLALWFLPFVFLIIGFYFILLKRKKNF
jgi:cytochrome c-type biogenesis protein CcmH